MNSPSLAAFVFPGFQTLDLFGPLEILGDRSIDIDVSIVAETLEPVVSVHGHGLTVDASIHDGATYDYLLIPGGDAALVAAERADVTEWIAAASDNAQLTMTVCTGSILLAATGLLDGRRATTNKQDFRDTTPLRPQVNWVARARWVEDGAFFTSSGVSAGMDMTLAALERLYDRSTAENVALGTEYEWHDDPNWDPFAERSGLV